MKSRTTLDVDEVVTLDSPFSEIALAPESFSPGEEDSRRQPSATRGGYPELQGGYVGHLRRLTPQQKERVKSVRAKSGLEEAVALAKKLAR